jgi:hypothetical protein
VRWAEHGTLSWSAGSTPVSRTLFLVPPLPDPGAASGADVNPGRWRVTFEDGRDFHPWTVGAVEHLCGRDLYRGGVEVPPDPSPSDPSPSDPPPSDLPWQLHWHVTGPEKDYTMHTRYVRSFEA